VWLGLSLPHIYYAPKVFILAFEFSLHTQSAIHHCTIISLDLILVIILRVFFKVNMSFFPSPQLEELRARLSQVADAIFDRSARLHGSPFGRPGAMTGADSRLLSLCGGPGRADWVLQHLGQHWSSLNEETQRTFRDDWDSGLSSMLRELTTPCATCPAGVAKCNKCRYMVPSISEKLERLAEEIVGKLEIERARIVEEEDKKEAARAEAAKAEAAGTEAKQETITEAEKPPPDPELKEELEKLSGDLEGATKSSQDLKEQLEKANGDLELLTTEKEELTKEIEGVKADRTSAREALGEALHQLDKATIHIERLAKDLEVAKRWKMAAEVYHELRKMREDKMNRKDGGALPDDEKSKVKKEAVLFKYKQVSALMNFGTYPDPELLAIAEELWEDIGAKGWMGQDGKLMFEPTSKELRKVHEDYCSILRGNKRYDDAERECMFVWYLPSWWIDKDAKDDWRYDTAYRIAGIMNEKKNYEEAVVWHKKVVQWALDVSPRRMKRAARSGIKLISLLESLKRENCLVEILTPIWAAKELDDNEIDILTCGYELGSRLLSNRPERAAPVLKGVWEGMKATKNKNTMEVAELLAKAYGSLEKDEELEQLYPWIIDNLTDDKKLERNKYRYALGYVQFTREKEEAEGTLRKAWHELEQDPRYGRDHRDTLQSGLLLGQVLVKKGALPEALAFLRAAWEGGHKYSNTTLLVRAGEFYSDALTLTGNPQDLDIAERVLDEVWKIATRMSSNNFIRDRNSVLWPALLSAGDCYGRLLLDRQRGAEAEKLLMKVIKLKKDLGHEDLDETQALLEEAKRLQLPPPEVVSNGLKDIGIPSLGLSTPERPRSRAASRRRQPRKRPGFLSDVAWWMMTT
jgi:archaellum component FlaC